MAVPFSMSTEGWPACASAASIHLVTQSSDALCRVFRLPYNLSYFLEALSHYQNIQLTSGLSLTQFADSVQQNRGFLDDHEYVESVRLTPLLSHRHSHRYPYLEELKAQA